MFSLAYIKGRRKRRFKGNDDSDCRNPWKGNPGFKRNPTVEVEVTAQTETTGKKTTGRESVPSGASTGRFEAMELRDGQERYFGLGVQRVVDHINTKIRKELLGMNVLEQVQIDRKLVEMDGTDSKENLGANALLGVSLACARCAAAALDMPLYRYLGGTNAKNGRCR